MRGNPRPRVALGLPGSECGVSLLKGLELSNPDDTDQIITKLEAHQDSAEWWAFLMGTFISFLRDAVETSDVQQAVSAMGCVERCRSMLLFKEHLEEVVWMGQSAKRVVDILHAWDNNKTNADEGFWQITFRETSTRFRRSSLFPWSSFRRPHTLAA
jgi:hypothetical protein